MLILLYQIVSKSDDNTMALCRLGDLKTHDVEFRGQDASQRAIGFVRSWNASAVAEAAGISFLSVGEESATLFGNVLNPVMRELSDTIDLVDYIKTINDNSPVVLFSVELAPEIHKVFLKFAHMDMQVHKMWLTGRWNKMSEGWTLTGLFHKKSRTETVADLTFDGFVTEVDTNRKIGFSPDYPGNYAISFPKSETALQGPVDARSDIIKQVEHPEYAAGVLAFKNGLTWKSNPHKRVFNPVSYSAWHSGWYDADAESRLGRPLTDPVASK